ncbi:MAG TPA: hypothetical protein HA362_05540 [Nanoarchaeota archaeon]|nr:hypothetical protein [Nanoarchaeota archaeon]
MKPTYHTLNEFLDMIEEPNGSICRKLLDDNRTLFTAARGSKHNHQAWRGGYLDHITEIMNIAAVLYPQLNEARPLNFSLSDSLLVLYLHDLEKPWKYTTKEDGTLEVNPALTDKETQVRSFVEQKIREYGFVLTEGLWNGINYVEGEKNDYSGKRRTQTPLAAFAHLCDNWSARGWFDFPAESDDPWLGAKRSKQ